MIGEEAIKKVTELKYHTHDGADSPQITFQNVLNRYIAIEASDVLQSSADTERSETGTSYTLNKSVLIKSGGTIRVKFDLKHSPAGRTAGRIYVNDVAIGTERQTESETYITYSEDITVAPFDYIQVYVKAVDTGSGSGTSYIENFRLYYNETYVTSLAEIITN